MSLDHAANPGRHVLKDRRDDLYETPPEAVHALLAVERFQGIIWEPACGPGAIASVLLNAGHDVYSTDLVDYGFGRSGVDFLMETKAPFGVTAIITNPPFKLADEFARHAVKLVPKVAMLLRLAFLESERRTDLLEQSGLARVYVFRNRLPMMHRAGWEGPKAGSATAFAWFVWERGHLGPAQLHRISWAPVPVNNGQQI